MPRWRDIVESEAETSGSVSGSGTETGTVSPSATSVGSAAPDMTVKPAPEARPDFVVGPAPGVDISDEDRQASYFFVQRVRPPALRAA